MSNAAMHAYIDNERRRRARTKRVASVEAPVISGVAASGNTLTVSDGEWKSRNNSHLTFGYQWHKDGVAIPAATGNTYDVVGGDSGSDIGCAVVAFHPNGPTRYSSAAAQAEPVTIA